MAHLSRRSFVGAGLIIITASAVPLALPPLRSRVFSGGKFFDAVGICTHPNWRNRVASLETEASAVASLRKTGHPLHPPLIDAAPPLE